MRLVSTPEYLAAVVVMRALSSGDHESVWKKKEQGGKEASGTDGSIFSGYAGMEELDRAVAAKICHERINPATIGQATLPIPAFSERASARGTGELPLMKLARLQEDSQRYYVTAVLEKDDSHVRTAIVEWKNQSFEDRWTSAKQQTRMEIATPSHVYGLSAQLSVPSCTDNTWAPTFVAPPTGRYYYTLIWTGSEMIV